MDGRSAATAVVHAAARSPTTSDSRLPSSTPRAVIDATRRGVRAAQTAILVNAALAVVKLVAGLVGHTYALVADAVESAADVVGSLLVWGGLAVAALPADEDHPYGHGKAEALAAAAVALMMVGAAVAIAIEAVQEIRTPHQVPAPWTLGVLAAVMLTKWLLARRVGAVAAEIGSTAVKTDAWHHLSDAVTSAAAFVGIGVALWGSRFRGGTGWESADDWAALLAAGIIAFNGLLLLRPALHELMDRMPGPDVVAPVRQAAEAVPGVLAVEKLAVRKVGLHYHVDIHVQTEPTMPLDEAHALGGRVKYEIRALVPQVGSVLVHMEPYGV
jgi:cation diffusion facilitator family transporter